MLYRVRGSEPIAVSDEGDDFVLDPSRLYDSDDPADADIIRRFGRFLEAPNTTPETATAAPGEKRTTRRK